MSEAMSREDVERAAGDLPGWAVADGALVKELRFRGFDQAFAFLTRVAMLAEKRGHHPDFSCAYDSVRLELRSHDAGGVTERDVELARAIEGLLAAPLSPRRA